MRHKRVLFCFNIVQRFRRQDNSHQIIKILYLKRAWLIRSDINTGATIWNDEGIERVIPRKNNVSSGRTVNQVRFKNNYLPLFISILKQFFILELFQKYLALRRKRGWGHGSWVRAISSANEGGEILFKLLSFVYIELGGSIFLYSSCGQSSVLLLKWVISFFFFSGHQMVNPQSPVSENNYIVRHLSCYRLVIFPKSSSACDTYGQQDWYTYGYNLWFPYRFFQTPISTMQFKIGFQVLWGDHITVPTEMSNSISLSSQPHDDAPMYKISGGGYYMTIQRCNQVRCRLQLFPSASPSARTNKIKEN